MKLVSHSSMKYTDHRGEWILRFRAESKNDKDFDIVKSWFFTYLKSSSAAWDINKEILTIFINDEKEYLLSLLRWE